MEQDKSPKHAASQVAAVLFLVALLAYALDLHFSGVGRQLIGGDENHTVKVVLEKTPGQILTQYTGKDNSIALSFYGWIVRESAGLSELGMRLPSMICDVLLLLAPLLLRRRVGLPVAMAMMALLATSPLVVFYSIVARPYTPAALFVLLAFFSWDRWLEAPDRGRPWGFCLCSAAAVFLHLFCVFPVAVLMLLPLAELRSKRLAARELLEVWVLFTLAMLLLIGPGLPQLLEHRLDKIGRQARFWLTARASYGLSMGHLSFFRWLFPLLLLAGTYGLWRRAPRLAWAAGLIVLAQCVALGVVQPAGGIGSMGRYFYPVWPLSMLLVACGLDQVVRLVVPRLRAYALPAVAVALALVFPLASPARLFRSGPTSLRSQNLIMIETRRTPLEDLPRTLRPILRDSQAGEVVLICPSVYETIREAHVTEVLLNKRLLLATTKVAGRREQGLRFRNEVALDDPDEVRASGAKYLLANRWASQGAQLRFLEDHYGPPLRADDKMLLYQLQSR